MPVIGRCRLCLTEGCDLQKSHILPKFSYRRVREGKDSPVLVSGGTAMITDRQMTEHMLCRDCEQRFSKVEDVVARLLFKSNGTTPWMEGLRPIPDPVLTRFNYFDSSAVDLVAAIKFGVSIVWRASVSKEAPSTKLGPYEEPFRRFLLGETFFPDEGFLLISLLAEPKGPVRTDRTISTPVPRRFGHAHVHWFAFLGAVFTLGAGQLHHEGIPFICAARTGRVQVSPAELLIPMMTAAVQGSRPVGNLPATAAKYVTPSRSHTWRSRASA